MSVPSSGERGRRGGRRPGWALLTVLLVLAIAASTALVFTNRVELLKLAVILALWAAVVGAFVSVIYRRQSDVDAARARDLKFVYDLQLDREISARREYELNVETNLRRELAGEIRAQSADEVAALRDELASLRRSLEILFDADFSQRPALETERSYAEWSNAQQAPRPDRVASSRITDVRYDEEVRPAESPIIDVPEEPLLSPEVTPQPEAADSYRGSHRRPSEETGWIPPVRSEPVYAPTTPAQHWAPPTPPRVSTPPVPTPEPPVSTPPVPRAAPPVSVPPPVTPPPPVAPQPAAPPPVTQPPTAPPVSTPPVPRAAPPVSVPPPVTPPPPVAPRPAAPPIAPQPAAPPVTAQPAAPPPVTPPPVVAPAAAAPLQPPVPPVPAPNGQTSHQRPEPARRARHTSGDEPPVPGRHSAPAEVPAPVEAPAPVDVPPPARHRSVEEAAPEPEGTGQSVAELLARLQHNGPAAGGRRRRRED
ncbi:MAG TPA: DUF6779 domain-containing protein [Mycobacterium sp.]|nr:DUF6779 domain-containing protein [Mycobacterium sp.]